MNPTLTFILDRESVWLSESLTATLRVEGAAPLVVSVPKELLQPESAAVWRVRPLGAAKVTTTGERATWTLPLRLDPYVPGENVPLAFAPLTVKAGTAGDVLLDIPAKAVKVQTAIRDAKASDLRTITSMEEPPPGPAPSGWPVAAIFACGAVAVIVAGVVVARLRRRPVPVPPETPGVRFAKLVARIHAIGGRAFAEQLAAIVRDHVEARFAIPATRRTTGELCATAPLDQFKSVLDWCDDVKFSGREPTATECTAEADKCAALLRDEPEPS